ncbi:MAG TPA: peptidylprolyl isomerase [Acidimicrobiales bacterium]|nr:peptidylprolyl isomerase [Acidimicrobiales bacterium]
MRRPLLLLVSFAALAAVSLSGCGTTLRPAAATVNGEIISDDDFEAELRALRDNTAWVEQVESQNFAVRGDGAGTLSTAMVSQILSERIAYVLIEQELARRDVTLSAADEREGEAYATNFAFSADILEDFPRSYRETLVHRGALLRKLAALIGGDQVTDAEVQRFYEGNLDLFAEVCTSHILFSVVDPVTGVDQAATARQIDQLRAQAQAVRAEIDAGGDFEALARQHSVDPGSGPQGGALPCYGAQELPPEFVEALGPLQPGQVSPPVQTDFGIHLIRLNERRPRALAEVEEQIRAQLESDAQAPFQELMSGLVDKAKVSVNPRYGTYQRQGAGAGVVPPSGPTTTEAGAARAPEGIPGQLQP